MSARRFHLSCPYTSLPVCRCVLHTSAPYPSLRKPTAPRQESALRRALLLSLGQSLRARMGDAPTPHPALAHALHHKAAHGALPPALMRRRPLADAAAAAMAASDAARDARLVEASEKLARMAEKAEKAKDDLKAVEEARDEQDMIDERFVEADEEESDSPDDHFERRRAAAKRRSRARAKGRR